MDEREGEVSQLEVLDSNAGGDIVRNFASLDGELLLVATILRWDLRFFFNPIKGDDVTGDGEMTLGGLVFSETGFKRSSMILLSS